VLGARLVVILAVGLNKLKVAHVKRLRQLVQRDDCWIAPPAFQPA
jgi:hypothetical protein